MLFRQFKSIVQAFYALFADSGFAMAGAVAYSFVLSFFPFCIFLGALAGYFGGEALAKEAIARLFELVPEPVAQAIAPEVMAVMGRSRFGLLTVGALIALFFATSAIESLRAALNVAYRVKERRSYLWCVLESMLFVVVSAVGMLVLTWGVVVGPQVAARFKPDWLLWLADTTWVALITRYGIVTAAIGIQLVAYHLWLAAGQRRLADVWPGVVLSILLWVIAAQLFASWLTINDYSRFYAGLTRIMSALVFFQVSAIIVIVGAELNRGIVEVKRRLARGRGAQRRRDDDAAAAFGRQLSGGELGPPERRQRATRSAHGVRRRERHAGDAGDHLLGRRAAAQVGALVRRIGADNEEVARRLAAEMAGAGRQQDDIPRRDGDLVAARAAEHETRTAGGEAQHLVRVGVIVVKGVDPVAPLGRPAVAPEQILECRCRIAPRNGHGLAIEQHRQAWIVRHPAVGGELQDFGHD